MADKKGHREQSDDDTANRRLMIMLIAGMVLAIVGISIIFAIVH
ncbi:hypothetical protein PSQ19_04895 [Devosia algicola]|uniref:Uncharacterized protein n=1 Tax=Devosia algicola TaxID=3026418 RepID=A0ABY7YQI0_9HYPH|nr:hypothetical protein [Devosia algicola]WDR03447.1 hypothetical protein PSQ19_04895 [Devosia algicola]